MLIRKHLVYIDEESIRSIKSARKVEDHEDELKKEIERKREKILNGAKEEAQKILDSAKAEADKIIQEAQRKAQKILDDAKRRYEKEIEQYRMLKLELSKIISSFESKIDGAIDELVNEILPLLKVIVRKILLKEIDEEIALRRLKSAISRIFEAKRVKVRVNPSDLELIKDELEKLGYEIVPDPNLEKGDVILETEIGILDMSTSYSLKIVEDIIDEVI